MIINEGDKLIVRNDLVAGKMYNDYIEFVEEMEKYKNTVVTVTHCFPDSFEINEDGGTYSWTEDMVIPYTDAITLYYSDKCFIVSNRNMYYIVGKEEYDLNSAINTVIRYAEEKIYPKIDATCFIVSYNKKLDAFEMTEFTWSGTDEQKEQFNNNLIFLDKKKAKNVLDSFNVILTKGR